MTRWPPRPGVYTMWGVSEVGVRQARAELPTLLDDVAAGEPVTITRHGRPVAALLPAEAVQVWQDHQQAQADRAEREATETALGQRLPASRRTPVCPYCHSSLIHVLFTGMLTALLVNTADPHAGVLAVTAETDTTDLHQLDEVRCASCWNPLPDRPHTPGSPAHRTATAIAEDSDWPHPDQWEIGEAMSLNHDHTRTARIITAHDLARGRLIPVTRWEYLTGILDSERDQMRADAATGNDDW